MIKAWKVVNEGGYEENAAIVFVESRGKAKGAVHRTDGFDCEFGQIRATRCPEADKYAATYPHCVVDWNDAAGLRIYRELEWQLFESDSCDKCGKFESEKLPESKLETVPVEDQEWDVCKECCEAMTKEASLLEVKA
ncbi:MAG TPA: hypothetical protein VGH19_06515 [Verrucomicrobiae bacterium]